MATLKQLAEGIRRAHQAGNAEHVRVLGQAYRQLQAQQAAPKPQSAQQMADSMSLPIPGTEWNTPEQPARFQSPVPGGDFMNELSRSFAENVPIVGPLTSRAADFAGSQIASQISGQSPEELLTQKEILRARDAADQPVANAAGTVGGTVGPLMSLGTTQLGGQALGMSGPLWQRMLFGLGSGGTIAGGDALARGESWEKAGDAAKLGAGLGAAFPLAERGISALARALLAPASERAAIAVSSGLERDKVDPRIVRMLLDDMGPDAVLADLGSNSTRQAAALAAMPGEAQTIVRDAMVARALGANARIQGAATDILGEAPIPSRLAAEIAGNKSGLSPYYEQALEGAKAVDTSAIALDLDSMIVNERGAAQTAAKQVRQMLNVTGTDQLDPSPRTLLNTRHAIDGILFTDGAAAPLDSNVTRVLQQIRRQIDSELAAKVPGIKDVDAQYSELARQNQALTTGKQTLATGQDTAIRPAELADMAKGDVTTIVGPSGVPFRISQATRAEIDRLIGTAGNDINALKTALKGDGSWNREKLATLYGADKADALVNLLEREQTYNRTYDAVVRNSETAARQAAMKDVSPATFGERQVGLVDFLLRGPQMAANAAAKTRSQAQNKMMAELLMSQPSAETVDRLLAARLANKGLLGSAATPLLTNQGI